MISGLGMPGAILVRSRAVSLEAVQASLSANAKVASFAANDLIQITALPNDPDFSSMTNLHNVGQFGATNDADIDAPEAWDTIKGSPSVVVGVVDSGVDVAHPDLYLNVWLN